MRPMLEGACSESCLSDLLTQWGGLQACLWGSAAMLAACLALTFMLPVHAQERRVRHFDERQ